MKRSIIAMLAGIGAMSIAATAAQAAPYQFYKDSFCGVDAQCGIDFGNVPAGKLLTITNWSCYLRYPTQSEVIAIQLVVVNNSNGSRAYATSAQVNNVHYATTSVGREGIVQTNDMMLAIARPGQHMKTYAQVQNSTSGNAGTISQLSCGISGELN